MNKNLVEEEKKNDFIELQERLDLEEEDAVDTIIPPVDIVAFNEQRSCADLYRMYNKGNLDIRPDFQRGIVWTNRAQTLFIDSLKKQLPIPSMCISLDIKTQKRYVIDGLQRISSIIKFLDDQKNWKLASISDVDNRLSGRNTDDIRKDDMELVDIIENASIPITIIRCNYNDENHMKYLFQIFYRLNTGGNKLYNQEIRNCIFQGPFNTLLKYLAVSDIWLNFSKTSVEKVEKARMANEERILRFFAFYENYQNYKGKLAVFLNEYMNRMKNDKDEGGGLKELFNNTIHIASKVKDISQSKNIQDALFVGIAKNINILVAKSENDINSLYKLLMSEDEFSTDSIQEGLGAKEKVISRINKSIEIFSRG